MSVPLSGLNREEKLERTDETTLKCHRCFSTAQIKRVCHHCGRYLCEKCESKPIRWLRRSHLYQLVFKDYEFSDLYPLESELRSSAHCHDHIHYEETLINILIWLIGGVGLFVLALSLTPVEERWLALGLGLVTLFIFLILLRMRSMIYRLARTDHAIDLYPLFPRYKVEITESAAADFIVNKKGSEYLRIPLTPDSGGKITISLQLTPDDYERFKNREGRCKDKEILHFSAGYLALDNLSQVIFSQGSDALNNHDSLTRYGLNDVHHSGRLQISGMVSLMEYKMLCQDMGSLKIERHYKIKEKSGWVGPGFDKEFPFWIVPDLTVAGRELVLLIYVAPDLKEKLVLEHLTLKMPDPWRRQVFSTNGIPDNVNWSIHWTKYRMFPGVNRLFVRFATPVCDAAGIHAKYKISIDNFLLSKLNVKKEGHLWYATGEPVKPGHNRLQDVSLKTEFAGNLELDTCVFKLQRDYTRDQHWGEKRRLRPDHSIISVIVNALTKKHVDVKSIIETPARIGEVRTDAQLWDHYWEINGRFYDEKWLQYVEVHVIVYGQENQAKPLDQEYVRWRLYLRSGLSLNSSSLERRLENLYKMLRASIESHLEAFYKHIS